MSMHLLAKVRLSLRHLPMVVVCICKPSSCAAGGALRFTLLFATLLFAKIVALTQGWGVQWLYSHEAGGASAFFDQNEFAQWRVSNLGPAADCCSGNDRLCRRALAEAQRGQTNKQFPSTDPDNSSYQLAAVCTSQVGPTHGFGTITFSPDAS
jgi:hypothetical protein